MTLAAELEKATKKMQELEKKGKTDLKSKLSLPGIGGTKPIASGARTARPTTAASKPPSSALSARDSGQNSSRRVAAAPRTVQKPVSTKALPTAAKPAAKTAAEPPKKVGVNKPLVNVPKPA